MAVSRSNKLAALALVAALMAGPAIAQPQDSIPAPSAACGPGNTTPGCQRLRQSQQGNNGAGRQQAVQPIVAPRLPSVGDEPMRRFFPPNITALLNDRRVDPVTRNILRALANKPSEDWTLADLNMVSSIVPMLTEMYVPTAALSRLYEFLNLDPRSLFEPQLGDNWQAASTAFDPRNYYRRRERCVRISEAARTDPNSVKVQELLNCAAESGGGR